MKRFPIAVILLMTFLLTLIFSFPVYAESEKVILHIDGMAWGAWPLIIKKALEGLEGVEKATISYEQQRGEVSYDPDKVGETDIINKVKKVGFMAKVVEEERGK